MLNDTTFNALNTNGQDLLNGLVISDEARKSLEGILEAAVQGLDLKAGEMTLQDLGSLDNPQIMITATKTGEPVTYEIGYINIDEDTIDYNIDYKLKESIDLVEEINQIEIDIKNIPEAVNELVESNDEKLKANANDIKKDFEKFTKMNADKEKVEETRKVPGFIRKQQALFAAQLKLDEAKHMVGDTIDDAKNKIEDTRERIENSKIKQFFNERKEAKANLKDAQERLAKAYAELRNAMSLAKIEGLNPRTASDIEAAQNEVYKCTQEAIVQYNAIPSIKDRVMESLSEAASNAKESVAHSFDKIRAATAVKVNLGIDTLNKYKNDTLGAIDKCRAGIDTKFTDLALKADTRTLDFFLKNYKIDHNIANDYQKTIDKLEKSYDRLNAFKTSIKNAGRAIIGKELLENKTTLSASQQERVNELKGLMKDAQTRADESLKISRKIILSMEDKQVAMDTKRENVGLKSSWSLDDRIKDAKARYQDAKNKVSPTAPSNPNGIDR